ncbi:hypothetical protein CO180_04500 [candidate division WWE3 bacterium CG_4_9_14_3_um_filter_41_6]|uniref:Guanylate kinase-like domain-containing protein n=1 Tax=candidate division WWE3 bacterium CG_4_10_14_0_2_um_filter_41_14 TaxID=1975072 RepID=A0A2M7TIX9_UNCKA|nr:MAG: hypothetical protein COY32_03400 [candidate division WWE3 bacterium CG_4_10_14_0_2_um_filter_41_14]PJA38007.1 MAG: hypothetical protein CO180_04500 [candidate division WWE3 bacterium CG_4_9_14_3_um_filter_41_6]
MINERDYIWGQNQKLENIDRSKLPEIISQGGYQIILIAGPNGVGKGMVIQGLLTRNEGVAQVSRITTRSITSDENQYHQVSIESFFESIDNGSFVEWGKYGQGYYGTTMGNIADALSSAKKLIIDIDLDGGLVLRNLFENIGVCVYDCFISPIRQNLLESEDGVEKALGELRRRLLDRDRGEVAKELEGRLRNAGQMLLRAKEFRHIIVNERDSISATVLMLEDIVL